MEIITYQRDSMGYPYLLKSDKEKLSKVGFPALKGVNLFTPVIVGFMVLDNGYVEISKSRHTNPLANYGVTVVVNGEIDDDRSTCFMEYSEVSKYLETLKTNF